MRVTRCLVVVAVTMVATLALTSTGAPQGQAEQHLQRGVELLEAGHLAEAIDELQHAVALQPGDARAQYQLGRALSTAGRQTAAAEHLRAALENTDEPGADIDRGHGHVCSDCHRRERPSDRWGRGNLGYIGRSRCDGIKYGSRDLSRRRDGNDHRDVRISQCDRECDGRTSH